MQGLYSISPALFVNIRSIGKEIRRELQGSVSLLEYITLPEAGQHVILRFEVREKVSSLDEIDALENTLSRMAGEGFWVVLVGETYNRVKLQLPLAEMPMRLEKFAQVVTHKPVPVASTPFASEIENDGRIIRSHIPLPPGDWVWEVEVPLSEGGSLPLVRIVSEKSRGGRTVAIGGREFAVEYVPHSSGYKGLVKAYPLARKAGRALVRYIFEHTDNV